MTPLPDGGEEDVIASEQLCPYCAEVIGRLEEVVLVQIVSLVPGATELLALELLDDEGDFVYDPYFLHFGCWENLQEALETQLADTPAAVGTGDFRNVAECQFCGSGIHAQEHCGTITLGELHASRRSPNGQGADHFLPSGAPDVICLYCLTYLNENELEFWEFGVAPHDECADCLFTRCWRIPNCPCLCHIHPQEEQ